MRHEAISADVGNVAFTTVLRGYDRDEVDEYVERVAQLVRTLQDAVERSYMQIGEDLGELLQHARDEGDAMMAKAEADARGVREAAAKDAQRVRQEADSDASAARVAADESSSATRSDAEAYAAATRDTAERDAAKRTAEADGIVKGLERDESDIHERLRALRVAIEEVTRHLRRLEKPAEAAGDKEMLIPPSANEVVPPSVREPAR